MSQNLGFAKTEIYQHFANENFRLPVASDVLKKVLSVDRLLTFKVLRFEVPLARYSDIGKCGPIPFMDANANHAVYYMKGRSSRSIGFIDGELG